MSKVLTLLGFANSTYVPQNLDGVNEIVFTGVWISGYEELMLALANGQTQVTKLRFCFFNELDFIDAMQCVVYTTLISSNNTVELFDFSQRFNILCTRERWSNNIELLCNVAGALEPLNPMAYIILPRTGDTLWYTDRRSEEKLFRLQANTRLKHVLFAILSTKRGSSLSALKKLPTELSRYLVTFLTNN